MPELPEVETIKRDLKKELVGEVVTGVTSDWAKKVKPSVQQVEDALKGSKVNSVTRRGKLLILDFDNDCRLLIHLKMSGRLLVRDRDHPEDDYTHHVVLFKSGKELRFSDMRKFGYMKLINRGSESTEVQNIGPDPLEDISKESFRKLLKGTRKNIKVTLMDQRMLSGVGNIYANDALFEAGIDPRRTADSLSSEESGMLYEALQKVLKEGLQYRGASDNWYVDVYGQEGSYQEHFRVYGRKGEECPTGCGGRIKYTKIGGRGTFYCEKCQE